VALNADPGVKRTGTTVTGTTVAAILAFVGAQISATEERDAGQHEECDGQAIRAGCEKKAAGLFHPRTARPPCTPLKRPIIP
jgi:hypothetical protein